MSDTVDLVITTRPFEPSDRNFILKTWLRSYRRMQPFAPDDLYYPNQQQVIDSIFQSPSAKCVIACDEEKPEFIFGFAVGEHLTTTDDREPLVMHYTFTKLMYRRLGVARELLEVFGWYPGRTVQCTQWSQFCYANRTSLNLMQNDYFLRGMQHGRYATHDGSHIQNTKDISLGKIQPGRLR